MKKLNLLDSGPRRRDSTKAAAERLEAAGRIGEALELYRAYAARGPREWMTTKKIADLLARLNRLEEAALEYAKVAEVCAARGSFRQAVAAWKRVLILNPRQLEPHAHLADLYAKQGYKSEARAEYSALFTYYLENGEVGEAEAVARGMAGVDDLRGLSVLVRLYETRGDAEKASELEVEIAARLADDGREGLIH